MITSDGATHKDPVKSPIIAARKYKLSLDKYRIVYLIGYDCVIQMEKGKIYTTNPDKYEMYVSAICDMKAPTYLDKLIEDFDIVTIGDISTLFG